MGDYIVLDGDTLFFNPAFDGGAMVTPTVPTQMKGSGPATVNSIKVCVVGDEKDATLKFACTYFTGSFPLPGTGQIQIAALGSNQQAEKTQSGGAKVILVGSEFDAKMTVQAGAQLTTPSGPQLDKTTSYTGRGKFISTNTKFTGT
jgi:hypothetical protein